MKQCDAVVIAMHCKLNAAPFIELTKMNKNSLVHPLLQVYVVRKWYKNDKNITLSNPIIRQASRTLAIQQALVEFILLEPGKYLIASKPLRVDKPNSAS